MLAYGSKLVKLLSVEVNFYQSFDFFVPPIRLLSFYALLGVTYNVSLLSIGNNTFVYTMHWTPTKLKRWPISWLRALWVTQGIMLLHQFHIFGLNKGVDIDIFKSLSAKGVIIQRIWPLFIALDLRRIGDAATLVPFVLKRGRHIVDRAVPLMMMIGL